MRFPLQSSHMPPRPCPTSERFPTILCGAGQSGMLPQCVECSLSCGMVVGYLGTSWMAMQVVTATLEQYNAEMEQLEAVVKSRTNSSSYDIQ